MQDIALTRRERLRAQLPMVARIGSACAVGLLCIWVLLHQSGNPGIPKSQVSFSMVREGTMSPTVRGVGSLRSAQERLVLAPADGLIEEVRVSPGATVEPGDILLRIQSDELEREKALAMLALADTQGKLTNRQFEIAKERLASESYAVQAQVAQERARREASAYEELAMTGVVSRLDLERAQNEDKSTRLILENAKRSMNVFEQLASSQIDALLSEARSREHLVKIAADQLDRLTIRATFRSTVLSFKPEELSVGARVLRGDRILRLVDSSQVTAELRIPSAALTDIQIGSNAEVIVFGRHYVAKVASIDPTVVDQYVTVSLEIRDKLPPAAGIGLQIEGAVDQDVSKTGLVLEMPETDSNGKRGDQYLYRLSEDGTQLIRTKVELGGRQGNVVFVEAGLKAGDKVAAAGLAFDEERERIEIIAP